MHGSVNTHDSGVAESVCTDTQMHMLLNTQWEEEEEEGEVEDEGGGAEPRQRALPHLMD